MEIAYKREMKHNYLIIMPEAAFHDCYEVRMMASNCIEGLLKFHVKQVDNRKSFYYEITSKQPLARLLDCRSLGAGELYRLMEGIARTLGRLEAYLLQEGQIWLEADYIYIEPEGFTAYFCLVPGRQGSFPAEMTALLQYLLGKVNHQDKTCVVMAYGLYQESLKDNYGIEDLMRLIGKDMTEISEPAGGKTGAEREGGGNRRDPKKEYEEWGKDLEYKGEQGDEGQREGRKDRAGRKQVKSSRYEESYGDDGSGRIKIKSVLQNLLITCAVIMGGPVLSRLVMGEGWIRKYWLLILLADMVTAILSAAGIYRTFRKEEGEKGSFCPSLYEEADGQKTGGESGNESGLWQMMFLEEDETAGESCAGRIKGSGNERNGKACSTVLLTEEKEPYEVRRLISMKAGTGDIVITYVPFIIGKQEGLADCILAFDAVSRLHARIDRNGEDYLITDLNSTNGTMVRGRMLETNEMAKLVPGDEVYIANIGFVFT